MKKKKDIMCEQLRMKGVPKENQTPVCSDEQETVDFAVAEGQISLFEDVQSDAVIDGSLAQQRLSEAIETQKPKKKRKSIITNLIFLVINVVVLSFIISACLKEADGISLKEVVAVQGSRLWWLLAGLGLFLLVFVADAMVFFFIIRKTTGRSRFWTSYKTSAIGKYFEAITPFNAGGQPSQILTLTRSNMSAGIATSIPVIKLIIYNIVYVLVLISFFVFGIPFLPTGSALNELLMVLLKIFAVIGLIVTALISVAFVLVGSGKIIGRSLVRGVVKFGYGLHIVKDFRKTYNNVMRQVLEYQSSIAYLKKHKGTLFLCILFCLIEIFAYFSIPFTVVMAFSSIEIASCAEFFSLLCICITKFIICQMSAIVIPLPGGTGMAEFAFIAMFGVSSLIGSKYIVLGLLAWRFLTYYFTIIQGFCISSADSIARVVRVKKENKKVSEVMKN